jgi:hypothetical protein
MGLLALNLPVIGQSSATEDQKVRDALSSIQTLLNGNVDEANAPNMTAAFTTYKTVLWGGGTAGSGITGAGPWIVSGGPNAQAQLQPAAVGAANSAAFAFYLDPADFTSNARTTKLRIRWLWTTNAVASGVTLTPGLYPVGSFGGVSGAAPTIASLGTVVGGSTVTFTTPGAATTTVSTAEFTAPAANYYVFGFASSGAMAAGAWAFISAQLQVRQV